ncbi:MAG: FecR domain-containing protein [Candidatus Riflebacteria bacterium]|nr:FecR domain-containing protein [Candidatus Riflebacteria bacterium]
MRKATYLTVFIAMMFLGIWMIGCGNAKAPTADWAAVIDHPQGNVAVRETSATAFHPGKQGDRLPEGAATRTDETGWAKLKFPDESLVTVFPDTFFEVKAGNTMGAQTSGRALYKITPQKQRSMVETPHGVTAVLGTEFLIAIATDGTSIHVKEGKVTFTAHDGSVKTITKNQSLAYKGSGPLPEPTTSDPTEASRLFDPFSGWPKLNPGTVHPKN